MDQIRCGTIVAARDLVSSALADETVLLNFKSGVYYGLDAVGTLIWNLIQQPRTVKELRDAILNEYQVEPEQCERDLLALLEKLKAARLIELSDAPAA